MAYGSTAVGPFSCPFVSLSHLIFLHMVQVCTRELRMPPPPSGRWENPMPASDPLAKMFSKPIFNFTLYSKVAGLLHHDSLFLLLSSPLHPPLAEEGHIPPISNTLTVLPTSLPPSAHRISPWPAGCGKILSDSCMFLSVAKLFFPLDFDHQKLIS